MSSGSSAKPATRATNRAGRAALSAARHPCGQDRLLRRRAVFEVGCQPLLNLFIEVAAVFGLENPMPGVRPYQQSAGDAHSLQSAPILERIVDGHPEVAFTD